MMTVKEELLQKLEQVTEADLVKVLEFVTSLTAPEAIAQPESAVWQAYLDSKQERQSVYRHLATPTNDTANSPQGSLGAIFSFLDHRSEVSAMKRSSTELDAYILAEREAWE